MISNGGNFQVAARLAYITGNETYADWAEMVWDWMAGTLMFERDDAGLLYIWDNVNADKDCNEPVNFIWSYNYGVLLAGAAYMYNLTDGAQKWGDAVDEILSSAITLYFPSDKAGGQVMVEYLCEEQQICNQDQKSFKAYLSRWMAVTALLKPNTWDTIMPLLGSSGVAAAQTCTGGDTGSKCSAQWYSNVHTGETGVGEQMSALAVVSANLLTPDMAPLSLETGAESTSNPNEGLTTTDPINFEPITTADKAGAAILTILVCVTFVGGMIWIVYGE
jgi:mannan endo-1,6-alpha-mannosidase